MKKQIEQVTEFYDAFNIKYKDKPTMLNFERGKLRFNLMEEENEEYAQAIMTNDLVGVADALGDKLYILIGTILEHGMQHVIEEVVDEIHRSNMSKLEDGKPVIRLDGKILKGKNYFKPNLRSILESK